MKIIIRNAKGQAINIEAESTDSIEALKTKIEQKTKNKPDT